MFCLICPRDLTMPVLCMTEMNGLIVKYVSPEGAEASSCVVYPENVNNISAQQRNLCAEDLKEETMGPDVWDTVV